MLSPVNGIQIGIEIMKSLAVVRLNLFFEKEIEDFANLVILQFSLFMKPGEVKMRT